MKKRDNHSYELEKRTKEDDRGNIIEYYFVNDIKISLDDIKKGVEITWYSDETDFEIWFPRERNLLSVFFLCKWFSIKSRNGVIKKKIRRNLNDFNGKKDIYYYTIYTRKTQNMAEGNSSPKMIIKR